MKHEQDSIVGSRVVEMDYTSPTSRDNPGTNCVVTGQHTVDLGTGSRIVEVDYTSPSS